MTANVRFILNDKREIVILTVEGDNEILKSFVLDKHNYQRVDVQEHKEGWA